MKSYVGTTAFQSGWLAGQQVAYQSWAHGVSSSRLLRPSLLPEIRTRYIRRSQVVHTSANGNGVEPRHPYDPDDEDNEEDDGEFTSENFDPAIAKEKLIRIITELINDNSQIQQVERLILQLESLRATPITDVFTEMGLAGSWKLIFSSTRTRPAGNVRIRKIGQIVNTNSKQLINRANWSFAAKNGVNQIAADLSVICSYKFVGPGRLEVEVEEHKIKILGSEDGEKHEMPDDLQALVSELQLSLPIDFFDPSGLIDVSYMEPNFRLARFVGKRIAGVRNVFVRDRDGQRRQPPGST